MLRRKLGDQIPDPADYSAVISRLKTVLHFLFDSTTIVLVVADAVQCITIVHY